MRSPGFLRSVISWYFKRVVTLKSEIEKEYIRLVEHMLDVLAAKSSADLASLLEPIRLFVHDLGRFSSTRIFESKFKAFVRARDQALVAGVSPPSPELPNQEALQEILDSVLETLERGLTSSHCAASEIQSVIEKVREARTLAKMDRLSEAVIEAGNEMVSRNRSLHSELSGFAMEVAFCKKKIADLESQLDASKEEAGQDHLTGLRNRRVFDSDLKEAVERAGRFHSPLCLFLVDIDRFKEINDRWGHQVGDDVLVNFARLLEKTLRGFDLTYRLGGDEFAVIFAGCELEQANAVTSRVKEFVGKHPYHVGDTRFFTTISGGLALLMPGEEDAAFFRRADKLLYVAKAAGRNKVVVEGVS